MFSKNAKGASRGKGGGGAKHRLQRRLDSRIFQSGAQRAVSWLILPIAHEAAAGGRVVQAQPMLRLTMTGLRIKWCATFLPYFTNRQPRV